MLFTEIWDHNVRPPEEKDELKGHRYTHAEDIEGSPEGFVAIYDDLDTGKPIYGKVDFILCQGVDKFIGLIRGFEDEGSVEELHLVADEMGLWVEQLLLDYGIRLPEHRFGCAVFTDSWTFSLVSIINTSLNSIVPKSLFSVLEPG